MGNQPSTQAAPAFSSNVCPNNNQIGVFSDTDLTATYPNGLATDSIPLDPNTKTFPQNAIQTYVNELKASGKIAAPPTNPRTGIVDLSAKAAQDKQLQTKIQAEYCFYEARYMYAMQQFINLATSLNKADVPAAKNMGDYAKSLNLKINSLIEITNIIGDSSSDSAAALKSKISVTNNEISNSTNKIKSQYNLLNRENATIETQKEMIKYTKEKNDAILNQIATFTILNAFVIGAIYTIVRA